MATVVLLVSRVAADPLPAPHLHVPGDSELHYACVPGPCKTRALPPVHIVDEPSWTKLDLELRRLQDAETRYKAENTHMRQATSGWQPGWKLTLGVFVTGLLVGGYAYSKL